MAYETGVATSQHDLLDKLRLFLLANGWTVNRWAAEGSGYGLCVSKGLFYANFRSTVRGESGMFPFSLYFPGDYGILFNASSGFNAGLVTLRQPGVATSAEILYTVEMPADQTTVEEYHFFTTGNSIDIVAKKNTSVYTPVGYYSLHVGDAEKFGNFYHCSYYSSQGWNTNGINVVPAFFNGYSDLTMCGLRANSGDSVSWYSIKPVSASASLLAIPVSTSGMLVLYPIYIIASVSSLYIPIGYVPTVRGCNSSYVTNGEELVIGSDVWKTFKLVTANSGATSYGYAIKKVV